MYAAVDLMYMFMLIKVLGPGYVVWDKAASIRFKQPGISCLYVSMQLDECELQLIHESLQAKLSIDRVYGIDLVDAEGNVRARVEKTIYIARKDIAQ